MTTEGLPKSYYSLVAEIETLRHIEEDRINSIRSFCGALEHELVNITQGLEAINELIGKPDSVSPDEWRLFGLVIKSASDRLALYL